MDPRERRAAPDLLSTRIVSVAVPQRIIRFAWSARHAFTIRCAQMVVGEAVGVQGLEPCQHLDRRHRRVGFEPCLDLDGCLPSLDGLFGIGFTRP